MSYRTKLAALFEAIAAGRQDLRIAGWDSAQIERIARSGLGAVCLYASRQNDETSSSPHWAPLKAADLTARISAAERLDATLEIVDTVQGSMPLTLLKGMSVADEYYPEFHLRPMHDIDVLVAEQHLLRMENLLRDLGYVQEYGGLAGGYESHHHLAPFFHDAKNVCIEVHHHLLASRNRASRDPVFRLENVMAQMRRSVFRGREVYRLTPELQLVYLAAHWAQDFKEADGIIAIVDLIHLLRHTNGRLDWDAIFHWLDGSAAAGYVYLLISCLAHLGLHMVPDEVRRRFNPIEHAFGKTSIKAVHLLIDRYIMDGKDFGGFLTKRNLSIAWNTLVSPMASSTKLMLLPVNLFVPAQLRIQ